MTAFGTIKSNFAAFQKIDHKQKNPICQYWKQPFYFYRIKTCLENITGNINYFCLGHIKCNGGLKYKIDVLDWHV